MDSAVGQIPCTTNEGDKVLLIETETRALAFTQTVDARLDKSDELRRCFCKSTLPLHCHAVQVV